VAQPLKPAPANSALPGLGRVALVLYIVCSAAVLRLHPAGTGLDPSWAVALNYLHNAGFRHGRDIAFTYGPLAFLTLPMDFGSNLLAGALFQTTAWLVFSGVIAWLVYARNIRMLPLALFAFLLYLGLGTFHSVGYAGPDLFVAFLAVVLLGGSLEARHWYLYYAGAAFAAVLLALVKWSSGLQAFAAVLCFAVAMAIFDRRRAVRAGCIALAAALVAFPLAYLLYNPSVPDMLRYVRAGFELSAGHSAAQSSGGGMIHLVAALVIAVVYLGLLAWLYVEKQRSFVLGFALLPASFVEFKHSFIRYAGHIDIYFWFMPLVFGTVFLFTRFDRRSRWIVLALIPLILALRIRASNHVTWDYVRHAPAAVHNVSALRQLVRFGETRNDLRAASVASLETDRLPPELLARVGNATITVFPWEISYAAANSIHFVPFPIFSGFMAYTPFLDEWNALFLRDTRRAPAFVLVEWMSVDGRNPLLDGAATFTALFQHYEFDSQYTGRLLLRRRVTPRFTRPRLLRTEHVRLGDPIRFTPAHPHPMVARIRLDYNLRGRALRFLYRIPEVRATHASGTAAASARISTEVAPNGVPLNFLPANLNETAELFRSGTAAQRTDSLVIGGPGLPNFKSDVRVDFYDFPDGAIGYAPPLTPPDVTQLRRGGDAQPSRIETLNLQGVTGLAVNETVEVPRTAGYVQADGFAVDPGGADLARSVWINLDGKLLPADYGAEKPGVAALLGSNKYLRSGFSWTYPIWKLGSSPHIIQLVVISRDGTTAYEARPLRFRVQH
jgi:hypothetical protein